MMNYKNFVSKNSIGFLIAMSALALAGCTETVVGPPPEQHIFYARPNLQNAINVTRLLAKQDQFGILHIQVDVQPNATYDQYIDAFITFTRNGQFVEKLGPKPFVLRGPVPDTILFNSTQPADDYRISLDYSQ
jgi:hypothetical protein